MGARWAAGRLSSAGGPIGAQLRQEGLAALEALGAPMLARVVEFRHGRSALGQYDPGLPRGGEDVDVRRQVLGRIERPDPYEAQNRTGPGVMTPQCDPAQRSAGDALPGTAL